MNQENDLQSPIRRPRRRWLRPIIFSLIILICGMVIGSGMTLHILWRGFKSTISQPSAMAERITKKMQRRLDLTDEQTQAVREILNRHKQEFLDLHQEVRPRVRTILKSIRLEVSEVLTPEQAQKWQEYYDKRLKRWHPPLPEPPSAEDNTKKP